MRKICFIVAILMSVLGFKGYAQETGTGTVLIDGSFYTFSAQDVDEPRNEAFSFSYGTYSGQQQDFTFTKGVTYSLKGQNESQQYYVYVNGVQLVNQATDGSFSASVVFNENDRVEIYQTTPYTGEVTIDGQFYTFTAQGGPDNRNEPFDFGNADYDKESKAFTFSPGVTYRLVGQNQENSFFVYINGVQVQNTASSGFEASVQFKAGDKVEIYEKTPYVASVKINGQFYTFGAQDPSNPRGEAFSFTYATYDNEEQYFNFSPAVTYRLVGQNQANTFFVYVNGVLVKNTVESGFDANVQFAAGDVVEIYEATPYVGKVKINGEFYTFGAQNPDNPRDEAFAFTYQTYDNVEQEFTFCPAVTYTLKGQNPANQFFVYVNGVQVKNVLGEGQTGFEAPVKFQAGDEVEIYVTTPYVGTVTINGQFYTFGAQNPDDTRDEAFYFSNSNYDNEEQEFNFSPGVTYTLKGQNQANQFFVYVNGLLVKNTASSGFEANVKFAAGDKVEIFEATPYVGTVKINGQFYTFGAQNPDDTRDEAFYFSNATYDNEEQAFSFSPAVTYTLKGQNQANQMYVYINGVKVKNEAEEGQTGFVANVKFNAGDVVEILETTPYLGSVKVNGQFYTFVAQNPDNTRDEAFVLTNDTYENATLTFSYSPDVTYTLKGQNESNDIFVYINGQQLNNEAGEGETGYVANVKFNEGDVVEIYEETPYAGTVTIKGDFYTFAAQAVDDNRDEAFSFGKASYGETTTAFTYSPDSTYELKGQNEANQFFVYINGVQVANEYGEGQTGFFATVKFNPGDAVEIYEATPYVGKVTIDGQFYTFSAQDVKDPRNEAFAFSNADYTATSKDFSFSPGLTYTLKGQNEANRFFVYINGVQVANEAEEGQTGFVATVKFAEGDSVEIFEETPYVGTVKIDGQFYTFVAQNPDNTRDEAFAFTNSVYAGETKDFSFSPAVTYTLKGQNETNEFFVYINGERVKNQAGEGETGFVADVKFAAGDAVEIYQATPYVGTVKIDGNFYTFAAQGGDDNRNEPFAFTQGNYDNQTEFFNFSPDVTYTLKGQNASNQFFVYINGVQVNNEAEEGQQGFVATVKFQNDDVVEIYENTPYAGKVTIDGQFYTFVAQGGDDNRNEPFAFAQNNYENETEEFYFSPGMTYTLKGQNESNQFFVYVNGIQVKNEAEEGQTGFVASVKFEAGATVEIYEVTPYVGTVTIDGQFYIFGAQGGDDNRNEPFSFTNNTYKNETREFSFSPGMTYALKGQNKEDQFFVYINGVQIPNEVSMGQTGYLAHVNFAAGDVVEIYENTPYVGTVTIDGQFYTFVAQGGDDNRNEPFVFTNATYDNETRDFSFSPGMTYTLKGQNESNQFFVYIDGVQVKNEAGEGETGFFAQVKFAAGANVEIFETTPYVGTVTIDGQFYTFVAQGGDDNRNEPFVFTNGTYDNETRDFSFSPDMTYTLKGQNESNKFFVYINGVQVANEAEEGQTGYVATVKFAAGDVVEIYENCPFTATVTINGQFYTFVAQDIDEPRNEAFSFTNATYDNETREFEFSPAITYMLKGQNEANSFVVTLNGETVANEAEEGMTGFFAQIVFHAGDVLVISDKTSGINSIYDFYFEEGKVYNLQGVEMKSDRLVPGIYIVNGKKVVIK